MIKKSLPLPSVLNKNSCAILKIILFNLFRAVDFLATRLLIITPKRLNAKLLGKIFNKK